MATIRRAGFGTVFELEDSKVGIGTDAATHTLQALGNIRSEDAIDIGISSLTTYQGFVDKEARFPKGLIDNQSQSGSTSGEIVIDGDVTVSSATTFTSGPQNLTVTDTFTLPSGDTNSRALKPTAGSLRFNQDFATLEFYTGNNWATVNTFTEMQNSPGNRGRGVFGGGYDGSSRTDQTRHVNIMSQGDAIMGGDLLSATTRIEACGNAVRSVWGGGYTPSHINVIQYRSAASDGNTVDFGNLVTSRSSHFAASSSTRGVFGGGYSPTHINSINYVEIMTTGDALDFGDIGVSGPGQINATQSPTRAVLGGGTPGNGDGKMTTFNFSSKGNSVFFGNLTQARRDYGGGGNNTRGVFCGGSDANSSNIIDFITIASDGNATFFGDLTQEKRSTNCCDSQTRTIIVGSSLSSGRTNVIDFLNIASAGNAQDFGDDIGNFANIGTTSDSHGGLGGF
jgi:hypothetical protein